MNLKSVTLKNFRGYRNETTIALNDLSVFIGKNDAGKSTVLEALEIFFNNSVVKIEKEDLNVHAAAAGETKIEITCVFDNLPAQLVIDAAHPTTLQDEYLVNGDGCLEIKKIFTCGAARPRETVYLVTLHPTCPDGHDLLLLKQKELRSRAQHLKIPTANYDSRINSSLRSAIRGSFSDLALGKVEIQVDKDDVKAAWDYLSKWMPQYALFKSDRESTDGDKEVTNPMKVAVTNALAALQPELEAIQEKVKEQVIDVAKRTLAKLQEMNPGLASQLLPDFKADPNWSSLFNLSFSADNNISINKRGSGVRRLIVLNFFRAEAERRRDENNSQAIIYAFEEPENSQHPDHQEMLIRAFQRLSETNNTKVIVTTHNPTLAGLVEEEDLYLVTKDGTGETAVLTRQPGLMRLIADTLGVLPDPLKPVLFICVEGPNDVTFFQTISKTISQHRTDLPDLSTDERIAIFPLGGGTLKDWVTLDYLKSLDIPQFHIYDLDDPSDPPYKAFHDQVRARGGKNWAELTAKRETENYLHPNVIQRVMGHALTFGDMDDVPLLVAEAEHNASGSGKPWATVSKEDRKKKSSNAKRKLNRDVTQQMSYAEIQAADPNGDVIRWLEGIRDRIN